MKTVETGANAAFVIDLVDTGGSIIDATALTYALYDGSNAVVIAETAVTSFAVGDATASLTIAGSYHQITGAAAQSRLLVLRATAANGDIIRLNIPYLVLGAPLAFMSRSYQTYQDAELTAYGLPNLDAWNLASEQEKTRALMEAFDRIGRLAFSVSYHSADVVTSIAPQYGMWQLSTIADLNTFTPAEMDLLPAEFIAALKRAQVIEADVIMGGDEVAQKRENGLLSETVGESSTMWRSGRPLSLAVSKRTLKALSGYVSFGVRVGRS
ncbi:MAG: hypothetical protein ACXWT0_01665 [Methylobacter sp.]